MPLLTNVDIAALMREKKLIRGGSEEHISACSYDLGIGTIFRDGQVVNSNHPHAGEQIIVKPGEVVTMLTLEQLDLPPNIAATVYAMNGQSSEGLLVLNPGHVDPGFQGALTVKAVNLRKVPLALSLRERIFTVVFDSLSKDANPPYANKQSHAQRELAINKKDVEISMRSFSQLIALDSTFPTHQDVSDIVTKHWMTWLTFFVALGGFFAAVIAAIFGVIAVFQNMKPTALGASQSRVESESSASKHGPALEKSAPEIKSSANKNAPSNNASVGHGNPPQETKIETTKKLGLKNVAPEK